MLRSGYRALCARRDQLIMHKPSTGPLVENFDGVRAVAATMVFLQHALPFPGVVLGPAGVWLFFTLSGYLLYLVFLRMEAPLPNSSILVSYLVRRVFRLAPLYIAFLLFHQLFWLTIVPDAAWNGQWVSEHLLLLRADDHLWSIKTEMVFYLFLPLLILMLAPLVKPNYRLVALAIIAMLTWWFFEHKRILVLHGGMPYFTPFILGMMMVHVQPHVKPWMGRILALVGFLAILGFGIDHPVAEAYRFSIGFTQWEQMWSSGHYVYWACALLVLGVASYKSRFWGNPWLRLIGVVGYGFVPVAPACNRLVPLPRTAGAACYSLRHLRGHCAGGIHPDRTPRHAPRQIPGEQGGCRSAPDRFSLGLNMPCWCSCLRRHAAYLRARQRYPGACQYVRLERGVVAGICHQ